MSGNPVIRMANAGLERPEKNNPARCYSCRKFYLNYLFF